MTDNDFYKTLENYHIGHRLNDGAALCVSLFEDFLSNPYRPYLSLIRQAVAHCQNNLHAGDILLASKHAAIARSLLEALR
ncbi:MAG: hypothetical protein BroJett018_55000 [Chloroflexota bacterium]|nr:MAG: hypothetical protein BroJett018_55000 [Chloroflexota bacterium]